MNKLKLFIAIELPLPVKEQIKKIQTDLSSQSFPIALSKKENLHLTLAFLGEQSQEKLEAIEEILKNVTAKIKQFNIFPKNFGAFPNFRYPKIIWIGVSGEVDKIYNLQRELSRNLKQINVNLSDEDFKPHITIGKVKSYANKKIMRMIGEELQRHYSQTLQEFLVSEIVLFRSDSTPWGHVHTPLEKINFQR